MTTVNKEKTKINVNTRLITLSAVFAAMTYALTAFLHIPTAKGYIHIGDAVIFIAASLLPKPYAMASAAIGASLSDALSGYWIWVPATFVIKALTALAFTSKKPKMLCARNFTALIPALVLCVGGYGLYSGLVIYGSLPAGFIDAPANLFQTAASAAVYIALSATLDKSGIKKKLH
ncbi:MAG: TIGR04002 family protein [Ruminococcus sp.]|nr:TIGR04002 family protein [Ruminococcus sp.]